MSIVLGGEGQVSPVLLTGPLTLPPAEALLDGWSRTEHIQLKMADKTDLCTRGRAYTQLMWVGMQSCFKGRCKILAVAQSPDEFRSVYLLLRKGILPVCCVCLSVLRSLIC